ncbi:hypothetical protein B0H13DRAFT_1869020 [Mycena leptocephala]|nr:hypothetical protein B0H13DRAFT_1869020 [Mycena leptocephala]
MESALLGVDDLARSSRFAKLSEWKYFVVVSEERISILKGLNAGKWASFKACDNIRVIDRQDGGRRDLCTPDPRLSLKEFHDFTWHDRAFMRAVLHRDYLRCIPDIARERIFCESAFPGEPSFVMSSYLPRYTIVSNVQVATPGRVPTALRTVEWGNTSVELYRVRERSSCTSCRSRWVRASGWFSFRFAKVANTLIPRLLENNPASTAEYDVYAPTEIH